MTTRRWCLIGIVSAMVLGAVMASTVCADHERRRDVSMGPSIDDDFDIPSRFDRGDASWNGRTRFERERPTAEGWQLAGHCGRGYGPRPYHGHHHHHHYRPYDYYPRHDCYYDRGPSWGMYYGGPRSSFYFSF